MKNFIINVLNACKIVFHAEMNLLAVVGRKFQMWNFKGLNFLPRIIPK
jgi:hypothetical protein